MIKTIQHGSRYVVSGIIAIVFGFTLTGCQYFPESTFHLADASRLPKWITLPAGTTRANVILTISYYNKAWGSDVDLILQDNNKRTLERADGRVECREPFHLRGSASDYPSYEAITIHGATEIIEHRKMEPLFYVTDDPAVLKQYAVTGCN